MLNDVCAGYEALRFGPGDRMAGLLPLSFGAGLTVALWALASGAALHLFDPRVRGVHELVGWLTEARLTTLHVTPSLLRALTDPAYDRRGSSVIYIWVRTAVDWANEEAAWAALRPDLRPKVEVWNETFAMPFHLFRHRVREIAELNLSGVADAVGATWDEIPDGSLVVPVDDDDWFAPDLAKALERELDTRATAYYWTSSFVEVPIGLPHRLGLIRRRMFPGTPPRFVCTTNNYAMVKSAQTKALLGCHITASEWVERQGPETVKRMEARLSLMNRTLGSLTSLALGKPSITRAELIRKFHRYQTLYDRVRVPGLEWSRPYLARMSELMREVRIIAPSPGQGSRMRA
jgi:hypothetical protein